jgi:phosphatidylglycerol:prolipoprotein diacylglycerol transferase
MIPIFAAIPFFGLSVYNLDVPGVGVVPVDPWAILVALGFVAGLEISRARAIRMGLDVRDVVDGAVVTVLTGFLVGHIYTVLFYFPERIAKEGIWAFLYFWTGFSSVGGFIGAVLGSTLFYGLLRRRPYWRFADLISYGFPFGWFFGRLGCGVVHDHIGLPTTMPWGMDFDRGMMNLVWTVADPYPRESGVHHELGLYEAAFMVPVMGLWWWLGRKDRAPGFFTLLFFALYAPFRILLDFLRQNDATYFGLTPAQYGLAVIMLVCVYFLVRLDTRSFKPWALDGKPDQARRAHGPAEGDAHPAHEPASPPPDPGSA